MAPAATTALAHERVEETPRAVEGGLVALDDAAAGPRGFRPLTLSVRRAEDEAPACGCIGACLDTRGFQARGFYEKQGYAVFGALPDRPPGHARFFLPRRLDAPPPPA